MKPRSRYARRSLKYKGKMLVNTNLGLFKKGDEVNIECKKRL